MILHRVDAATFLKLLALFRGFPLSVSTLVSGVDLDCGGHNPMLVTHGDTLVHVIYRSSAGLPECRFCPCSFSGVVSLTLRKRGHRKIISHSDGHSVVIGKTKKPVHSDMYRLKIVILPPWLEEGNHIQM